MFSYSRKETSGVLPLAVEQAARNQCEPKMARYSEAESAFRKAKDVPNPTPSILKLNRTYPSLSDFLVPKLWSRVYTPTSARL